MFRFLSKFKFGANPLDGLDFGQEELNLVYDEDLTRVWMTPEDTAISLNYLQEVPDLLPTATSDEEFCEWYRDCYVNDSKDQYLIAVSIVSIGGCKSLETFSKLNHPELGTIYIGGLILPFAESRFMLTVEKQEAGMTGIREALLFELMRREGRCRITDDGEVEADYDPYGEEFDAQFENHPLSVVRRTTRDIRQAMKLNDWIRELPEFPLPPGESS